MRNVAFIPNPVCFQSLPFFGLTGGSLKGEFHLFEEGGFDSPWQKISKDLKLLGKKRKTYGCFFVWTSLLYHFVKRNVCFTFIKVYIYVYLIIFTYIIIYIRILTYNIYIYMYLYIYIYIYINMYTYNVSS